MPHANFDTRCLRDALARVIRIAEALADGDRFLAAQALDDLAHDLTQLIEAHDGRPL
jgi:hypothetical protein